MGSLPSGTVTFLFSDVEGGTQVLERHGLAIGAALTGSLGSRAARDVLEAAMAEGRLLDLESAVHVAHRADEAT